MKKITLLLLVFFAVGIMAACKKDDSSTNSPPQVVIRVTYPNGGEILNRNSFEYVRILWDSQNVPERGEDGRFTKMYAYLVKGGQEYILLSDNLLNIGIFDWDIRGDAARIQPGSDYKLRIKHSTNAEWFDDSDGTITIQ